MTVQDVCALVTLMGLHLSEASCHQKTYKELLAHIDDGHALTLEKVQHEIIRFSDSRAPRAFALTHAGNSSACNH
jgi:predicted AAA+ superfamily ATPase